MSIILKIITTILKFLILLIVLCLVFVILGVSVSNLSYDNVNIKTLYLKYDKKLILNIDKLIITDKNTNKKQIIDAKILIRRSDNVYNIDIKELKLKNESIFLSSNINLKYQEIKDLISKKNKNIELDNVSFIYDKEIVPIKAKKVYLRYENDDLYVKFDQPTMDGIKLNNTTVKLENLSKNTILYLNLYTNSSINDKILWFVKYYGLDLPLAQLYGKNNMNLKLKIPFDDNPIKIDFDANIKKSKIVYLDKVFISDELDIQYHNNILTVRSPKINTRIFNEDLILNNANIKLQNNNVYVKTNITDKDKNKIYLDAKIDLINKKTHGKVNIIKYIYKKQNIKINNQNLSFKLNYKTKIHADIFSNLALYIQNKKVNMKNLKLKYIDNKIAIIANILYEGNSYNINTKTDLKYKKSKGEVFINRFNIKDTIRILNQKVKYKVDFSSKIKVYLNSNMKINIKENHLYLKKLRVKFVDGKLKVNSKVIDKKNQFFLSSDIDIQNKITSGDLFILSYADYNLSIKNQKLKYKINFGTKLIVDINTNMSLLLAKNYYKLTNTKINYKNDNVKLYSAINDENNNSILIDNIIDINNSKSYGNIFVNNYKYDKYISIKDENITYKLDYKNKIELDIKQYDLKYEKIKSKHSLSIYKLDKVLNLMSFINSKNNSSKIKLFSLNDFNNTDLIINNLNIDINSTKLFDKNKQDTNKSVNLPKINIKLFNSDIAYDNFNISSDVSIININKHKIDINITPKNENNNIKINIEDKNILLNAQNISDKFINKMANKQLFKGGTLDLNIKGTFDKLKGKIKFHKTTLQDVQVINNLITFVNTTPAIINPLLTLPTLFRLGETGFDLQGYYIKKGYIKFDYNVENKYLDIYSLYTRGKMADFKGKAKIDIKNEKIKSKVDVIFLKDYSKFINHIPLIGYIIIGDDGDFVTTVDINGTFDTQDFTTHTVKNISHGILNMIKRTLTAPFLLFKQDKKKKEEE